MQWIKDSLGFLIFEALIINLGLIYLSLMGLFIGLALAGPWVFYTVKAYEMRHRLPQYYGWMTTGYAIIALLISLLAPSLIL